MKEENLIHIKERKDSVKANTSWNNFVLQDGGVEGYWGNEHVFNSFHICLHLLLFVPLLYKDGV